MAHGTTARHGLGVQGRRSRHRPCAAWAALGGIQLLVFFLCDMRNSARVCASTSRAQPNGIFTQSQGYHARPKLTGCPPAEGRSAGCHRLPLDGPSPPSLTGRRADARSCAANWESSEQHYQASSSFPQPGARRPRGARRAGAPLAPPIPRRRARPARKSQGPRAPPRCPGQESDVRQGRRAAIGGRS